ncbi:MAG: hypothetical protein AB1483_00805 [Candidatus Zixiibacteriota bacterium]
MKFWDKVRRLASSGLLPMAIALLTQSATGAEAVDVSQGQDRRSTLEIQSSFNLPRRDIFRDLYGSGVTFAIRYEHSLSQKIGWGVRVSRVQLSDYEDYSIVKLGYRDFTITPVITYNFAKSQSMRLFSGGGLGLSFRKISLDSYRLDQYGNPSYAFVGHQSEASAYGLLMLGADLKLAGKWYFGARVTYDRHFFGDVTTGDLGDTGGFNFGGSLGIRF